MCSVARQQQAQGCCVLMPSCCAGTSRPTLARCPALQSTHEDKDYIHIVMELCQGGELFDHIVEAQHFTERKVRVPPEVGVCACAGILFCADAVTRHSS
jgi:hypothetical protein